jgi:hypothetical protein
MAITPTVVPSSIEQPDLVAIDQAGKQVRLFITAFLIEGGKATPVTWPHIPGAAVFEWAGGQYRRFDLATGLVSGESFTSLSEVKV